MTIDYPVSGQVPQLRSLWKKAFGDTDEFLDPFFEIAYDPMRCRCVTMDGKVTAMLFWFETSCDDQRFAYVYAVSTDPDYQNRGLCRALMADTEKILREQGYHGILLYPASEGLSGMYAKMGYARCTAVTEFTCEAGTAVAMRKLSRTEYACLRREYLPAGGVIQEGTMLDFLATQADFYAGENWVAVLTADGEHIRCHELLGDASAASGIVGAFGKKNGFFRTFGCGKPFAMLRKLAESCKIPVYFGLPLD